jgi:hypothetical protein
MPAWLSPFSLPEERLTALAQAGWEPWSGTVSNLPSSGVLLYDTPDRLLALGLEALQAGYEQLQDANLAPRAVAIWRLLGRSTQPPEPEPLTGSITLALLSASPALLDAYIDLELKADLRCGEPDVAYRRRLGSALKPADVISAWQSLQEAGDTSEAREEAELTLLQLHQVQEELEQLFLADRDKASKLEALQQELQEQRTQAEQANQKLQEGTSELQAAREEAELTLLQLHQVQEELEHYFLLSRGQHQQLERYSQLQQRSQRLLAKLAQPSSPPSGR